MIKTILFDNNGVLSCNDKEQTLPVISKFLGMKVEDIKPKWDKAAKNVDIGKIKSEQFLKEFLSSINCEDKYQEFVKLYSSNYNSKSYNFQV